MADGTIKQINPFTDNEVWSVPGRRGKPTAPDLARHPHPLSPSDKTSFCAFCTDRLLETPPEKSRLIQNADGSFHRMDRVRSNELWNQPWLFRRVPNLFEIVTVDYWKKNYLYHLTPENRAWKERYLAEDTGKHHVHDVLRYKLRSSGVSEDVLHQFSEEELQTMSDAFFGGGHEIVIASPHFTASATDASELFSSADMTPDEHDQYIRFTIDAMRDIFASNRYIRYISVFQNWLQAAGASFDHLHKQLVGIDDWGASIRHQVDMLRKDPNCYNELGANLAGMQNLIFAENDHAIAYAGIGAPSSDDRDLFKKLPLAALRTFRGRNPRHERPHPRLPCRDRGAHFFERRMVLYADRRHLSHAVACAYQVAREYRSRIRRWNFYLHQPHRTAGTTRPIGNEFIPASLRRQNFGYHPRR